MSRSNLGKKFQPAKKAWKRFCRTVESKIRNFDFSKAVNVIKSSSNRIVSYCSLHFLHVFKKRAIQTRSTTAYFSHHYNFYGSNSKKPLINDKNFSPIYIDQLYAVEAASSSAVILQAKKPVKSVEIGSSSTNNQYHNSRGKQVLAENVLPRNENKGKEKEMEKKKEKEKEKILYSIEDAWREVVLKSPQLRPVDDRAEEFISKFRQDIKIQKDKSNQEFQEMLARGT